MPKTQAAKVYFGACVCTEEVPGAVFAPVDLTLGLATAPHSVTVG